MQPLANEQYLSIIYGYFSISSSEEWHLNMYRNQLLLILNRVHSVFQNSLMKAEETVNSKMSNIKYQEIEGAVWPPQFMLYICSVQGQQSLIFLLYYIGI